MSRYVARIGKRHGEGERDVLHDVGAQRRRCRYRIRHGRASFDKEARWAHRRLRQSIASYIRKGNLLSLVTAPVIYSLLVPLALIDVWVWTYQWICFPVYGIGRVRRRRYFVMDRRRLAYLNGIEKANCTFCSYANGLIAYVREIAARTELYWCPIKHAWPVPAPHQRYHAFFDYGDAEGYRLGLVALRRILPRRGTHGRSQRTRRSPAARWR